MNNIIKKLKGLPFNNSQKKQLLSLNKDLNKATINTELLYSLFEIEGEEDGVLHYYTTHMHDNGETHDLIMSKEFFEMGLEAGLFPSHPHVKTYNDFKEFIYKVKSINNDFTEYLYTGTTYGVLSFESGNMTSIDNPVYMAFNETISFDLYDEDFIDITISWLGEPIESSNALIINYDGLFRNTISFTQPLNGSGKLTFSSTDFTPDNFPNSIIIIDNEGSRITMDNVGRFIFDYYGNNDGWALSGSFVYTDDLVWDGTRKNVLIHIHISNAVGIVFEITKYGNNIVTGYINGSFSEDGTYDVRTQPNLSIEMFYAKVFDTTTAIRIVDANNNFIIFNNLYKNSNQVTAINNFAIATSNVGNEQSIPNIIVDKQILFYADRYEITSRDYCNKLIIKSI